MAQQSDHTNRWRTVDIVVAAVLAVAFGVVFWGWDQLWNGPFAAAFAAFKPASAVVYGVWLVPAVLGPLIIRKPGAGVFVELAAALVSALLGSPWGFFVVVYGLFEGAAGEFGFAVTGYRGWRLPNALFAGATAGACAALLDLTLYYSEWGAGWQWTYLLLTVASSILVAGAGSWALTRGLAQTGVLDRFPSGRERSPV